MLLSIIIGTYRRSGSQPTPVLKVFRREVKAESSVVGKELNRPHGQHRYQHLRIKLGNVESTRRQFLNCDAHTFSRWPGGEECCWAM